MTIEEIREIGKERGISITKQMKNTPPSKIFDYILDFFKEDFTKTTEYRESVLDGISKTYFS